MIEDDPVDSEKFANFLRNECEITITTTLKEALSKISKENFDVVLLDLGLPDSITPEDTFDQVWEVIEAPIIVSTGMSDDFGVQMLRRGAQDYLLKTETSPALCRRSILYAVERYKLLKRIRELQEEQVKIFRYIKKEAKKKLEGYHCGST